MAYDSQYNDLTYTPWQLSHSYGKQVHLLSSPLALTLLARLGMSSTEQPLINDLVEKCYRLLIEEMVKTIFPVHEQKIPTRMQHLHPEHGIYHGPVLSSEQRCLIVDLARAGTYPSHLTYEYLHAFTKPSLLRQDHFYIARRADAEGKVVGVDVSGSKIGGDKDGAIVLLPDPMGATGGTIVEVYQHYQNKVAGKAKGFAALHLIVTPEYLKQVTEQCPELTVFALRIDRGLSDESVLNSPLGRYWEKEKGLNDHSYIVPGAGGLGEVLNNSYC